MTETKTKTVTVRLTDKEQRELHRYCNRNKRSISFAVRKGIENLDLLTERYSGNAGVQPDNDR